MVHDNEIVALGQNGQRGYMAGNSASVASQWTNQFYDNNYIVVDGSSEKLRWGWTTVLTADQLAAGSQYDPNSIVQVGLSAGDTQPAVIPVVYSEGLVGGTGNDTYVVNGADVTISDAGGGDTIKSNADWGLAGYGHI